MVKTQEIKTVCTVPNMTNLDLSLLIVRYSLFKMALRTLIPSIALALVVHIMTKSSA